VAVVTGSRSEYGLLRPVLDAIQARADLELQLVVTGMHLLDAFGRTVRQIEADGWPIAARIPMQRGDDHPADQARGLGRGVQQIGRFFCEAGTDVVLVLGDRIEAMAGALAGVTTGRIVAHIHGGDLAPGDFDDALRDAITQLAHLHFTASARSTQRVLRLGAPPECVYCVGAPGLDRLRQLLRGRLRHPRDARPVAMIVQHASGRPPSTEQAVMLRILRAAQRLNLHRVIVYPNSDRGFTGVARAIEQHRRRYAGNSVEVYRSLPRDEFLHRLINADVLIGNSSCGLIEAPFAGTPSINVGTRQAGREPGGPSVIHCDETYAGIEAALRRALQRRVAPARSTRYGDGRAGERIAQVLSRVCLEGLRQKRADARSFRRAPVRPVPAWRARPGAPTR